MPRSQAFSLIRRSLRLALQREHVPTAPKLTRRSLLQVGAGAALTAAVSGCIQAPDANIAIVGAGMAGLTCAYRLQQAGISAHVFDAARRSGGRMYTARGRLEDGQVAELGGELIDSDHLTMQRLAAELDIQLDDLPASTAGLSETLFIAGQRRSEAEIVEAFVPVAAHMQRALAQAEADEDYFAQLDALGLEAWLDSLPDLDDVLRSLLRVAYIGEYGRELSEQSVFNLLWLIDSETPEPFRIFGDSDERYHTHLGSDTFTTRLAAALERDVELDMRLVRIQERRSGRLRLVVDRDGSAREYDYDRVILALPWTLLRQVELDVPLPDDKRQMIAELGYGLNAKLMLQFQRKPWQAQGQNGSAFSDNGVQSTWDTARGQAGESGLLTVFLGGNASVASRRGTAEERARDFLPEIDQLFSGASARYRSGSALRMYWPSAPFALGSYACYAPGQAVWSGSEGEPVGRLHFCGEHTSEDFQGYMEGAAESGERAANEVLAALSSRPFVTATRG
jgi:monoamine oxidase